MDFNRDGYRDLAVGIPGEDVVDVVDAGAVAVVYGSPQGLTATNNQLLTQGADGVPDVAESGDEFGAIVATGDFDFDGFLDLAIGAAGEDVGDVQDAGSVTILYGSAAGLTAIDAQLWTQDSIGLDPSETGDHFGQYLRTGTFDGSPMEDLAIAAPSDDVGSVADAGAVFVLYGTPAGLSVEHAQMWTEDSPGLPTLAEVGDGFGAALAAGSSFNADGFDDLAVGVPDKDVAGAVDAGSVVIIRGSRIGLQSIGSQEWTEDSPDVLGTAEAGDHFGSALTAIDINLLDSADLTIGAPGQDVGSVVDAGEIHVLFGAAGGLTANGNQAWNLDSPSVVGTAVTGDGFGTALRGTDLNGDRFNDIVIGTPGKDLGPVVDAGVVHLLYGSSSGLTGTGSRAYAQRTPGVPGNPEAGDRFGASLRLADYDGDGLLELAVAVPGEGLGSVAEAGEVDLLFGTPSGPGTNKVQILTQNTPGILDDSEFADRFGTWVA